MTPATHYLFPLFILSANILNHKVKTYTNKHPALFLQLVNMFTVSRSRLMMLTSASFVMTLNIVSGRTEAVCETPTKNTAFVFIKPHANTLSTQHLVSETFKKKGIKVLSQGELTGEQIDEVTRETVVIFS